MYQEKEKKARDDVKNEVPHSEQSVCVSADFGQNQEVPCFNSKQPGCTNYYSPLTINNFGVVLVLVVDHSHKYENGNHMYWHVYHEGIGKKGGTIVASLLVYTLWQMNVLLENDPAAELNIFMDNCSGQNKNNSVLKLAMWLKQMGYFK